MKIHSHGSKAWLSIAIGFASIGMILKLIGGILYGSRSVLVDGATCIANIASGILLYYSLHIAGRPPDIDHPYGHSRLVYAGVLGVLIIYSFIAGASTIILYDGIHGYRGEEGAPLYALLGTIAYGIAIITGGRAGYAGSVYSGFTISEVIEGLVTSGASYLGYSISYIYDLSGGLLILAYLLYELYRESGRLVLLVSDVTDPGVERRVKRLLEERGLRVEKIRLRVITPGRYHGDAIVVTSMPYEVADLLVDEAVDFARRMGVDLVVHIDVRGSKRGSQ